MNKMTLMTIVLVTLVLVSGIQAVQLTGLKSKLVNNELSTKSVSHSVGSSGGSGEVAVPDSLQNLPQMVGGC